MATIKIKINCLAKSCGECRLYEVRFPGGGYSPERYCLPFKGHLKKRKDKYLRLLECLIAEEEI